ncbi:MAG TPA: DUF1361 domain-containing protein, partial [Flavisolibacter sp.]
MKYLQRVFLYRFYASRNDAEQMLLLCSLFSLAMILFRVLYTGHLLFAFLVWNLFLAFVPYAISRRMTMQPIKKGWKFLLAGLVWLLFVPNSFYILTDLFHLDMNESVPLWYDLALLLSFAWSGLLFGIVSVRQMEKLIETNFNRKLGLLFIMPVMALNGFGVFVGRSLRFNSWDVITNPLQLIHDIV